MKKEDPLGTVAFSFLRRCNYRATRVWSTAPSRAHAGPTRGAFCRVPLNLHPSRRGDEQATVREAPELFELQSREGPCLDCYRTGKPVMDQDQDLAMAKGRWPRFSAEAVTAGSLAAAALDRAPGPGTDGLRLTK